MPTFNKIFLINKLMLDTQKKNKPIPKLVKGRKEQRSEQKLLKQRKNKNNRKFKNYKMYRHSARLRKERGLKQMK